MSNRRRRNGPAPASFKATHAAVQGRVSSRTWLKMLHCGITRSLNPTDPDGDDETMSGTHRRRWKQDRGSMQAASTQADSDPTTPRFTHRQILRVLSGILLCIFLAA